MIDDKPVVTFLGECGKLRADVSFDDWRKEPYIVEYYVNNEWVGHTCWKTESAAEEAATKYTFGEKYGTV